MGDLKLASGNGTDAAAIADAVAAVPIADAEVLEDDEEGKCCTGMRIT